ncbi:MAG: hypothetical protein ACRCUJ_02900 [Phocaeicola sp.]
MTTSVKLVRTDLVLDGNAIAELSMVIQAEGRAQDKRVQVALASATIFAHMHGNVTPLNQVLVSLSKGMRTNAAKAYAEDMAPVRWNKKKKEFATQTEARHADILEEGASDAAKALLATILETEWLSYKPEGDFKPKDAASMTERLIKSMISTMDDGDERNDVHADDVTALRQALETIKQQQAQRVAAKAAAALAAADEAELEAATAP